MVRKNTVLKTIFDIIVSILGLIILFPILIIVCLLSLFFQGLPLFFFHDRLGKDEIKFTMIKFRTMSNGESISAEHDITRLTKWGRLLRKTSIDELPVLINVIKGDMSLVGPRPLPVKYLSRFDSFQKKRMKIKPGITGLAQINGRNRLSWDERFNYDIDYIRKRTFLLDLMIIFKTIFLVTYRKNVDGRSQEIMPEFMGSKNNKDK
ncbi:MAG: sugar transferase [Candidatus Marinimicrobia bacterium]|nr:sugar transferase [Candidatus Neomarinimicrobiota bacterium]